MRPPIWTEAAYRIMGVRLDRTWESWLRADLGDARWLGRQAAFTVPAFAAFGVAAYAMGRLLGVRVQVWSFGGLLGACLGQFVFPDLHRERMERVQLGPGGAILRDSLTFAHRSVVALALYLLLFGLLAAFLALASRW